MDNEYSARSNFIESVAIDNFMKMRLDKMFAIQRESRQRKQNQKTLSWVHDTNQTDSSS